MTYVKKRANSFTESRMARGKTNSRYRGLSDGKKSKIDVEALKISRKIDTTVNITFLSLIVV